MKADEYFSDQALAVYRILQCVKVQDEELSGDSDGDRESDRIWALNQKRRRDAENVMRDQVFPLLTDDPDALKSLLKIEQEIKGFCWSERRSGFKPKSGRYLYPMSVGVRLIRLQEKS